MSMLIINPVWAPSGPPLILPDPLFSSYQLKYDDDDEHGTDGMSTFMIGLTKNGNYFFTAIFAIESAVKLAAMSPRYFFQVGSLKLNTFASNSHMHLTSSSSLLSFDGHVVDTGCPICTLIGLVLLENLISNAAWAYEKIVRSGWGIWWDTQIKVHLSHTNNDIGHPALNYNLLLRTGGTFSTSSSSSSRSWSSL